MEQRWRQYCGGDAPRLHIQTTTERVQGLHATKHWVSSRQNAGAITIPPDLSGADPQLINAASKSITRVVSNLGKDSGSRFGCGLSRDRCWITWHGENLLWLPAGFRPSCSGVSGSTVVIGCNTGRVVITSFSPRKLSGFKSPR